MIRQSGKFCNLSHWKDRIFLGYMRYIILLIMTAGSITAQDFSNQLLVQYETFQEEALTQRRFKYEDLTVLINKLPDHFDVAEVGRSFQGRTIKMISIGSGPVSVLLWSQMHGNEATATMAIFDIFNYLSQTDSPQVQRLLKRLRLHFIPMLNPDGAELFQRRTSQGIDMNRDALSLQCPESKILKSVRDSLNADWGFNLHDQQIYYNVGETSKPATLSFLAPAYNHQKEVNPTRERAIQLIAIMNKALQEIIPGQVGRYDDTFEPRAFGDNIQKWGTSTILIESGGYPGDLEKQFIRKLNYVAILTAFDAIAERRYEKQGAEPYWDIPFNSKELNDVLIRDVQFNQAKDQGYRADIAIKREELDHHGHSPIYFRGTIEDLGDLSTQFGYQEVDGTGLTYESGKIYPEILDTIYSLDQLNHLDLLAKGYTYIRLKHMPDAGSNSTPFNLIGETNALPDAVGIEQPATFLLLSNNEVRYAVVNGFVHLVNGELASGSNGWVDE